MFHSKLTTVPPPEPQNGYAVQVQQPGMAPAGPPVGHYVDIPVITDWRNTDSVPRLREIMIGHERGVFTESAVLVEEMMTDDRIAGVLNTRIGGLLAADLVFAPSDERAKSAKVASLLEDGLWWQMADHDAQYELLKWHIMLGFAVGEIVWKTTDGKWTPKVTPYHPRHAWWNWSKRCFQLVTGGPDPALPNDIQQQMRNSQAYVVDLPRVDRGDPPSPRWFVWGRPYSWMRGAIRYLSMKFIDRQWCERDWSRYCEKHGLAIIEAKVPAGIDDNEKAKYINDVHNIGSESTILTPQTGGGEGVANYGIELHEATARSWETFKARKESLDVDIAVALLGQNLTTEVASGSLAAANVHEGIRIDKKREDAGMHLQLHKQVLIPWAIHNYNDERLAPMPEPQIDPPDDSEAEARGLSALGDAIQKLKGASRRVDEEAMLEANGIPMLDPDDPRAKPLPAPPGPFGFPGGGGAPQSGGNAGGTGVDAGGGAQGGPTREAKPDNQDSDAPQLRAALAYLSSAKRYKPGSQARKRVAKYQDTMAAHAAKRSAAAMGPILDAIREDMAEVAKLDATNEHKLHELKRRVVRRYSSMPTDQLAAILRRLNTYWHLAGRDSVLRGG